MNDLATSSEIKVGAKVFNFRRPNRIGVVQEVYCRDSADPSRVTHAWVAWRGGVSVDAVKDLQRV